MNRQGYFYEEFILGLGFLSGIWLAVGTNPESIVFDSLLSLIKTYNPDSKIGFVFWFVSLILTLASILIAYFMGGTIGIIGVACAYLGGYFILSYPTAGLLFVGVGWLLGDLGVKRVISSKGNV